MNRMLYPRLFEPITVGGLELRNRLVMSPMEVDFGSPEGEVTERTIAHYRERAMGGIGLVIVEATCVEAETGRLSPHQLVLDSDRGLAGFKRLARAVQGAGAPILVQLYHAGRRATSRVTGNPPVAPSAIANRWGEAPRELATEEIGRLVERFAEAAARARMAGFDGVELHAAHGYLISQFLSPTYNRRQDDYGGSLENRARFLLEVVAAVRRRVGESFPLFCRLSAEEYRAQERIEPLANGITVAESQQVARWLEQAGVSALDVSASLVGEANLHPMGWPEGMLLPLAAQIREVVSIPVIATGRISPKLGEEAVREGRADLIAWGRSLLADPHLPSKLEAGRSRDINPCIVCPICLDPAVSASGVRCAVNPTLGQERELQPRPAASPRRVLVIGGGPGGMEAARVARLGGHRVTLWEQRESLGGSLLRGSIYPAMREARQRLRGYLVRQMSELGIEVRLRTRGDVERVLAERPDAVVVATGEMPEVSNLAGADRGALLDAGEVLRGAATGDAVVVLGGGFSGCEAALWLAQEGKRVALVTRRARPAEGVVGAMAAFFLRQLREAGVSLWIRAQVEKVEPNGVTIRDRRGQRRNVAASTVVVATGRPDDEWVSELRGQVPEVLTVGGGDGLVGLTRAMDEGFRAGLALSPAADVESIPAPSSVVSSASPADGAAPSLAIADALADIWRQVLGVERLGREDNFFDLGGHSLAMTQVRSELQQRLGLDVPMVDLFRFPTVGSLARHLGGDAIPTPQPKNAGERQDVPIAIIAMNGRFPGAAGVEELWQNLCDGVESISFFGPEEVEESALTADPRHPNFVGAAGLLDGAEAFDAAFFDTTPREAEITDPQQRLLLECAWQTLELAGYDPQRTPGRVGVFAGSTISLYLQTHLLTRPDVMAAAGFYQLGIGNAPDHLPARVAYKLGLRGPAINVQAACSTSLVAVHLACSALREGGCDLALAGGVTVQLPQKSGYLYEPSMIMSPDGHCRAFDAAARGTVGGSGLGLVALKRLPEALADGDPIRAVIRGSAINNDGALKAGYTAPGVDGQAEVITRALAAADVDARSIGYLEAHGTGTELGDPIEVAALNQAFAEAGDRGFCALGSLKTNIGHLDAAAGVAGLIKAALTVERGQIPPSLHFEHPNPKIDFASSSFFVNTDLREWQANGSPRRAGVSSFGIGGNNAHAVLEEPPEPLATSPSRRQQLLLLSARTEAALEAMTDRLARHLESSDGTDLADVAYTLQIGRQRFEHRRALVCADSEDAAAAVLTERSRRLQSSARAGAEAPVVFLFPGQGAQFAGMAQGLYSAEPRFREEIDRCLEILDAHSDLRLRPLLLETDEGADERLRQTHLAQPALFVTEYALARLWMAWGLQPKALIGHSVGEWVAACLAGVVDLEDALELVVRRGELMQQAPAGAMLSVPLGETELVPLLDEDLALAAVNAPSLAVVSGPVEQIERFAEELEGRGIEGRALHTSHAFHSPSMESARRAFAEAVAKVELRPPRIPFISNLTGTWIEPQQATEPAYWGDHLRSTVRFADGLSELLASPDRVFLEVGPGRTLSTFLRQQQADRIAVTSMRRPRQKTEDSALLLEALGRLWLVGVSPDWSAFYRDERRRRVILPTYPFERRRHWVEPGAATLGPLPGAVEGKRPRIRDWFYLPTWKRSRALPQGGEMPAGPWLFFVDSLGVGEALAQHLRCRGAVVVTVRAGETYQWTGEHDLSLGPDCGEDYERLFAELAERDLNTRRWVHFWGLEPVATEEPAGEATNRELDRCVTLGVESLLTMVPVGLRHVEEEPSLTLFSSGSHRVAGRELPWPEKACALGALKVLPQEHPELVCRSIDLDDPASWCQNDGPARLAAELLSSGGEESAIVQGVVALRGGDRWLQAVEPLPLPRQDPESSVTSLRSGGVYLITGGLGDLGLLLAHHLAESRQARLILIGRTPLPDPQDWDAWLNAQGEDDPVSQRLRRIEAAGGELLVLTADVADRSAMETAILAAEERFGPLHGVIHAAGISGQRAWQPAATTSGAFVREHLRPKLQGLRILDELLADRALDFVVVMSSISSLLGGLGLAAYATANAAADASVERRNRRRQGVRWLSVDWEGWRADGPSTGPDNEVMRLAMTPAEGIEAFERLMSLNATAPEDRVVVSSGDFQARLDRWLRPEALRSRLETSASAADSDRPSDRGDSRVAPRTATEEAVADIWQELLGITNLGVHEDFFELGGHSLLATQVLTRLRDRFGIVLDLAELFDRPTVAALAQRIDAAGATEPMPASSDAAIGRRAGDEVLPLSYAQQRMWFIEQLEPGGAAYILLSALRLEGSLSVPLLERSLRAIVRRHEALRTTFPAQDGQPVQRIASDSHLVVPLIDLTALPDERRQPEMRRLAEVEGCRPFDLARGPLLRVTAVRLSEQEHVVFNAMHHIVSDAWSMEVLSRELTLFYGAFARDQQPTEPELPVQYADYALWQERWLESPASSTQLSYWTHQLDRLTPLKLPTDFPRPRQRSFTGALEGHVVPASARRDLEKVGHAEHATLFMVLVTLFDVLFHHYSQQQDIVVGSNVANRNHSELEGLIGCFINSVVLRCDLSGNPTFRELLRQVRRVTLEAHEHQDLPFEKLVEALNPQRDTESQPLFQIKLDMLPAARQLPRLPGLQVSTITPYDPALAHSDLIVYLSEVDEGVKILAHYRTALFKPARIVEMLADLDTLIAEVSRRPDVSLHDLGEVLEASRERRQSSRQQEYKKSLRHRLQGLGKADRRKAKKVMVKR